MVLAVLMFSGLLILQKNVDTKKQFRGADSERQSGGAETDVSLCLEKLSNSDLRDFAKANSAKRRSILIEIYLPDPKVEFAEHTLNGKRVLRPKIVTNEGDPSTISADIKHAQQLIQSIVDAQLNWIQSAHLFVTDANSEEICQLVKISQILKILPNHDVHK